MEEFDIHPLLAWQRLSHFDKIATIALTLALLGGSLWFIWLLQGAYLSAL